LRSTPITTTTASNAAAPTVIEFFDTIPLVVATALTVAL
jgi:hypothetical protein